MAEDVDDFLAAAGRTECELDLAVDDEVKAGWGITLVEEDFALGDVDFAGSPCDPGDFVTGETSEAVTLTLMGGVKEVVQRSNIKAMKSLDRSLMPLGLEAGINKEQMADLLAFLLGR